MPSRCWRPSCSCPDAGRLSSRQETCPSCGAPYEHTGMCLSMIDSMHQSMRRYGLPPLGRHRHMAAEVMKGAYRPCPRCAGSGYLPGTRRQRYLECPDCHGLGGILAVSVEEFVARRERIVAQGGSVLSCTVYDPVTGEAQHLDAKASGTVNPPLTPEEEDEQGTGFLLIRAGPDLTVRELFEAAQRMLPRGKRRTWEEPGAEAGKEEQA